MRLSTALLADAAATADGKLFVHGGGWDVLWTNAVPTVHPTLSVAMVLEFEWSESNVERTFEIALFDEDNNAIGVGANGVINVGHPPALIHGSPIQQPLALTFPMITFQKAGAYYFMVKIGDQEVGRIRFAIKMQPRIPAGPVGPAAFGLPSR